MPTRSLALAMLVLLALTGASLAQAPAGTPAPSADALRSGSACGKFIEFEMADMSGPILLDPGLVSSVQPSAEKPKAWSLVRWRDGQTTVEGTVEQVAKKLGRTP